MHQFAIFFNSIFSLAMQKSLLLLSEIQTLLESSQFPLYLAVIGICMNIMDHYNKPYSLLFEKVMLAVFNQIKIVSLFILGFMLLTFLGIIIADAYYQSDLMNNLWHTYAEYQGHFVLFIASVILFNKLILTIYLVDLWQDNKVTAIGLLFTIVGFYYELKDNQNFDWIVLGICAFTVFMVLGNLNELHKKKSSQ